MAVNQGTMVKDLTNGNVTRQLLVFAFPLFISNALQAVYNIVDMVVVGRFIGGAGMSAVSIGGDLLHLLTFVSMGFASAGQVIIARHVGERRMKEVSETIGTLFTFLLSASVTIAVICFLLRYPLLNALNTPAESYSYAMDYLVTCIAGLVFIYGYNIVSAILRGMGDSRRPFVFVAIAAILNIILDLVFVVVFHMEVFGAALATVIGQGVSFISSLIYLFVKRQSFGFDFKLKSFAIKGRVLKPLVLLGIPMAIQSAAVNFSKVLLMSWINLEGVIYSALAGIFNKINVVSGVVSMSFTAAGSSMVGQNLGARKYERVPRILGTIGVVNMCMLTAFTAALLLFPNHIYGMFTSDVAVLSLAGILTMPIILNFYGAATRTVSFALINGSGNTKLNLAIALIDGILMRIGLAALLCFGFSMGSLGCWYGDAIAGFMPLLIGLVFYLSGRWKK